MDPPPSLPVHTATGSGDDGNVLPEFEQNAPLGFTEHIAQQDVTPAATLESSEPERLAEPLHAEDGSAISSAVSSGSSWPQEPVVPTVQHNPGKNNRATIPWVQLV